MPVTDKDRELMDTVITAVSICHETEAELNAEALAEMFAQHRESQWQDISTAPKDGSEVLLYLDSGSIVSGFNNDAGEWVVMIYLTDPDNFQNLEIVKFENRGEVLIVDPTHWQPLPTPPTKEK